MISEVRIVQVSLNCKYVMYIFTNLKCLVLSGIGESRVCYMPLLSLRIDVQLVQGGLYSHELQAVSNELLVILERCVYAHALEVFQTAMKPLNALSTHIRTYLSPVEFG